MTTDTKRLKLSEVLGVRRNPTVRMMSRAIVGVLTEVGWNYQTADDVNPELATWLGEELEDHRSHIMRNGIMGFVEWGWAPFEKVLELNKGTGLYGLRKLKPLLQHNTDILIEEATGDFTGFKQEEVTVPLESSLLCSFDVDGTDWRGNSVYWSTKVATDIWDDVSVAAERYDKKMSGAVWVVRYPIGETMYNGAVLDNQEIAKQILQSLKSSGSLAIPNVVQDSLAELDQEKGEPLWKVELMESSGTKTFGERSMYADKLIVRSFGFPERSVLEGQFGTKAEAEAHGEFAIDAVELMHNELLRPINWHLVNHLVRLNWGSEYENKVTVVANPLDDAQRVFLRDLYKVILATESGSMQELDVLDIDSIREQLHIPTHG